MSVDEKRNTHSTSEWRQLQHDRGIKSGLVDEDIRMTYCCKNTENKKCHV